METKNQESKFFSVEIGIETRRGNFIKHHSFVCKTQLDTMDVHEYYRKKYHGFAVNVESINEIIILDEKPEIKKPELNSDKVTSFISKMKFEQFSNATQDKLKDFNESRKNHNELKESLEKIVKQEIMKRSSLIFSVHLSKSIPDGFNGRTFVELPYTANLNGSITEHTEREIQEED